MLPAVTCTWPSSTISPSACRCTPSSCSTSPPGSCWALTAPCSSFSWSSRSSSSPSGRVGQRGKRRHTTFVMKTGGVRASCACLFVVRHAAGHPGEMRCHPSDQLSGSVRRWGYGRRRLPELHHMHRDVFRGTGSAARFHIQRVQGQKSRFNRWEGRRGKKGGRKQRGLTHLSYNVYRLKKEFKKSFTSCLSSISFPFVSMHISSFMPHLLFSFFFFTTSLSFCLRLYFSPPGIPFVVFYLPVSTYLSSFFIFSSLLHSKGPVPTYGQFGRLNTALVRFHTAAISILIY